jgi:phage baseplate assembly protein W
MSRADKFTQTQKIPDLFSDFLTDLTPHPITQDLTRLRNEASIKQSIKNLVLTNYGERPFQPFIGSSVNRSLFDLNDLFAQDDIIESITNTIQSNEPRVNLLNVELLSQPENNEIRINVLFSIINSIEIQSLDLILRRVR